MDNTPLFRACVKAIKIRQKSSKISDKSEAKPKPTSKKDKNVTWSMHASKSKELTSSITQLRDFLVTHRKNYINSCNALSGASLLSESQRDEIDTQTESAIRNARSLLKTLDSITKQSKDSTAQNIDHQSGVNSIIDAYLTAVCRMHSEQRAIRVAKANDMKRLSRLSALLKTTNYSRHRPVKGDPDQAIDGVLPGTSVTKKDVPSYAQLEGDSEEKTVVRKRRTTSTTNEDAKENRAPTQNIGVVFDDPIKEESTLNDFEQTQLTAENEQMFDKFNTMIDEIDQLANDVEEISRLQTVFTEHVLTQETTIDTVHTTTIHATEDIKYGNEQLKEAMKRKADLRVWVLFALLVLTFTLLFLDWYNP